jgi:hypothetical protein
MRSLRATALSFSISLILSALPAAAGTMTYGDEDCLGTGCYGASDPTAGATIEGLAPGVVTFASSSFGHTFPFTPSGDFAGTDQIYVGSTQTGAHDGYSVSAERIAGPQILNINYSPLVPAGNTITSFTLGVAADDFQFPVFGQMFVITINGTTQVAMTNTLNSLSQTGPVVQFLTVGLDPSILLPSNVLTVVIDQGGDGGDGWAADFVTAGVTTAAATAAPEPATLGFFGAGLLLVLLGKVRRRR